MIVEAYDGLAVVRSRAQGLGEVEWMIGPGLEQEAEELRERLAAEFSLVEMDRPTDWPFDGTG